ncbi:MAG: site-2 protease family protein [Acidobacteria bacterium]|nr:site-2 protease family protein [Acidobacteriota bacterium]
MRKLFRIGRIFGIEIQLHISWLITLILIVISLASYFRSVSPAWSSGLIWGSAMITSALFFASILTHELSHVIVGRWLGLSVKAIILFAFGGMAQIENEGDDAKSEFWIGIVGPFTSAAIGFGCLALALLNGWMPLAEPVTPMQAMIVWLGYINIGLAIFNLVPGFPMDGGHMLRAIIWWRTGDKSRATWQASFAGMLFAPCFIVIGILAIFKGAVFGGLWLAFIGWFLIQAARVSVSQTEVIKRLCGVCVKDVMERECPVIDGNTNLQIFVEDHLMRGEDDCFLIMDGGELTGLITIQEVKKIGRRRWPYTVIHDVMNQIDQLQTVNPEASITEALELMVRNQEDQLAVTSNGRLVGIISRDHIRWILMTHADLKMEHDAKDLSMLHNKSSAANPSTQSR